MDLEKNSFGTEGGGGASFDLSEKGKLGGQLATLWRAHEENPIKDQGGSPSPCPRYLGRTVRDENKIDQRSRRALLGTNFLGDR